MASRSFVADRICFLGFCELGTVSERVVVYSEKAREEVSMLFKTFHTDSFQGLDTIGKNVDCIVASQAMGDDGQKHNLYYWECPITLTHPIVRIELPVNLSMHVMSILLKSPLPPSWVYIQLLMSAYIIWQESINLLQSRHWFQARMQFAKKEAKRLLLESYLTDGFVNEYCFSAIFNQMLGRTQIRNLC